VTHAFIVARKELRALFGSPVALIFLGLFQLITLFTFFSASRFFARNLADVRPLFEWLPLLLVFLTAAVTMRAWAEERKLGTLEVLMTLPVRTLDLVLGKFFAATALVAVALALTLPLPLMVSTLGPLDWGPVLGGYLGALLLGALYASLGLFVSARTDNQVVSLMLTLALGGALYLVGTDTVVDLFGTSTGELLRALGTGARFESIERGVIDLRDLVYYLGLTVTFLAVNWAGLERDRLDRDSAGGAAKDRAILVLAGLVALNSLALVGWLAPVTAARADLTENGDYSISPTTRRVLSDLAEPLFIDGYFSERTHPLLAPLVPQLRDLLDEYAIAGKGRVKVTVADPNADPDLEARLADQYAIRSVPFQVDDRNQVSVVNSFFHVLVRYGDQYEVLSFEELIEFYADSQTAEVKLRNPEYDLTRAIKRVSQDFTSLASVLARLPDTATLTLYATPGTLPADFQELPALVRKVAEEVAGQSGGRFAFAEVDPSGDDALKQQLFDRFGLRPLAVDLFSTQTFYMDIVLAMGDKVERLAPRPGVSEADLREAVEAGVARLVPGQLTTVGLFTEAPVPPPPNPQIPPQFQPPPPQPDYRALEQLLGEGYEVVRIDPTRPDIPASVDVVIAGRTGRLDEDARYALDQYLMRGGRLIALAGAHDIDVDRSGLSATAAPALKPVLAPWGVSIGDGFVLDEQNAAFPRPVQERRGGIILQRMEMTPYPFFVDVRQSGLEVGHPALAGVNGLTFPWASPMTVEAPAGVEAVVLARSSAGAWKQAGSSLEIPAAPGSERAQHALAAVLTGVFPSAFAEEDASATSAASVDRATISKSLPDARLAVLASSDSVSDLILQLAGQPGGEVHRGNLQLLQNLIDWAVEDTDLLEIRSAGAFARTLEPLDAAAQSTYEAVQYALALALLGLVAFLARRGRAELAPLPFPSEAR
jgi:ABC-2 type transport system permease protein